MSLISHLAANLVLDKVKLGNSTKQSYQQAWQTLASYLLEQCDYWATRRWGNNQYADAVAGRAAALAQDGIQSCSTYFLSQPIIHFRLLDAQRHVVPVGLLAAAQAQNLPAAAPPPPVVSGPWELVLGDLLDLSRRSWTYLRLAEYRTGAVRGFQTRLATAYLGPGHDAQVSLDRQQREYVDEDLERVKICLSQPGAAPADAVEELVQVLNTRANGWFAGLQANQLCTQWGDWATDVLDQIQQGQPRGRYPTDKYPHLAEALNRISAELCAHVDRAAAAAMELCYVRQASQGPQAAGAGHPWANVKKILVVLPDCHPRVRENPPDQVLGAIANFLHAGPGPQAGPAPAADPKSFLRRLVWKQLPRDSVHWAVFLGLLLCYEAEQFLDVLPHWLPSPRELAQAIMGGGNNLLSRALEMLEKWHDKLQAKGYLPEWPLFPHNWQPTTAHLQNLQNAIQTVQNWINNFGNAPNDWNWPGNVDGPRPWVLMALYVMVREDLHHTIGRVYEAVRVIRPWGFDALLEFVQGLPPSQVVQRLQWVKDAQAHGLNRLIGILAATPQWP